MKLVERFREWRIERAADRIARRPHGRKARATYGADDAHDFLWPPVLEALSLAPGDRLLDVGCGGGAFLRHVLDSERGRIAVMTTAPEARGSVAAPEPFALRGRFHTDAELVALARDAGFGEARIAWRDDWAQLLVAQP